MLKRYGEYGQPCLVPDFSGITLSFSPFNLMLAVGLLYIAFIMFRYVPYIPDLYKTFPTSYSGKKVAKKLREWPTNDWLNLRPIL